MARPFTKRCVQLSIRLQEERDGWLRDGRGQDRQRRRERQLAPIWVTLVLDVPLPSVRCGDVLRGNPSSSRSPVSKTRCICLSYWVIRSSPFDVVRECASLPNQVVLIGSAPRYCSAETGHSTTSSIPPLPSSRSAGTVLSTASHPRRHRCTAGSLCEDVPSPGPGPLRSGTHRRRASARVEA